MYRGEEGDREEAGAMERGMKMLNSNALMYSYISPKVSPMAIKLFVKYLEVVVSRNH